MDTFMKNDNFKHLIFKLSVFVFFDFMVFLKHIALISSI